MKKLISLILILCMASMLIPAMAEDESVVGTWYLKEAVMGEMTMPAAMIGMSLVLEFKEDGTLTATASYGNEAPEPASGTWTQSGATVTMISEGEEMTLTLADGVLAMPQDGGAMNFTREAAAEESSVSTTVVAAESEEAFFGTWKLSYLNIMDNMVPVSMLSTFGLNMEINVTIEAGKATMSVAFGEESTSEPVDTSFEDGKLVIRQDETAITMSLTESGDLAFEMPINGETYNIYLSPVAAEEAPAA